jgi:hypothetical protein
MSPLALGKLQSHADPNAAARMAIFDSLPEGLRAFVFANEHGLNKALQKHRQNMDVHE